MASIARLEGADGAAEGVPLEKSCSSRPRRRASQPYVGRSLTTLKSALPRVWPSIFAEAELMIFWRT